MRINLEDRWLGLDLEKEILVYKKAKKLIEEYGIEDHVLELRQMTCMGGASYVVTSKDELDIEYIGYRGFLDYDKLCFNIEEMSKLEKHPSTSPFDLEKWLKALKKRDK